MPNPSSFFSIKEVMVLILVPSLFVVAVLAISYFAIRLKQRRWLKTLTEQLKTLTEQLKPLAEQSLKLLNEDTDKRNREKNRERKKE